MTPALSALRNLALIAIGVGVFVALTVVAAVAGVVGVLT